MRLGCSTITWGGVVGAPGGVTSVAELFYVTHGSTPDAIRDVAAAGYRGVEVFDGDLLEFADRPDQLFGVLEEAGVELTSVYTGANFIFPEIVAQERAKLDRAIDLAASFGASRLVVGGGARRAEGAQPDDLSRLAEGLDWCAERAATAGLIASYHPHLGTLVETPEPLVELMAKCRIAFCPDTAHLAAGGGDPADLIRRYADRLAHVHLKDLERSTREFRRLGDGDLDFDDILGAIRDVGYDDWLMVELDSYEGDPRAAAEHSARFVEESARRLGFVLEEAT